MRKRGRGDMRKIISNILMISLAVAFLVHFGMIAVWGQVIIQEPNFGILIVEILMLVGIVTFGVWSLVKECQRD